MIPDVSAPFLPPSDDIDGLLPMHASPCQCHGEAKQGEQQKRGCYHSRSLQRTTPREKETGYGNCTRDKDQVASCLYEHAASPVRPTEVIQGIGAELSVYGKVDLHGKADDTQQQYGSTHEYGSVHS